MNAPNFLLAICENGIPQGAADAKLVCCSVCIYRLEELSLASEIVLSIHISTMNSEGKRRQKCKQSSENKREVIMYSLFYFVIHGLQLCNTFQSCSS